MNKPRFVMTLALATVAGAVLAVPPFVGDFQKTYKAPKGSALETAACATCHVGHTAKLNPYGEDLKKAMASLKTKKVTPAAFKKIEKLDSDKDGVKNLAEIKKGTLPGDPKSK